MPRFKQLIPFSRKQLLIVSAPLLFVAFATQMNGQASVLILGAVSDNASVGIFNIALKVSMLMSLILAAVNVIAATKISELYSAKQKEELDIMISKISALGTAVGLPLFIFMSVFSTFLLGLFGHEFKAGALALIILTAGQFVNVAVGSTNYILAMTGHEKALSIAVGLSLLLNIILGLVLIPPLGVLGASISASAAMISGNIIMVVMVKKYLDVWPLPFKYMAKWIKAVSL
ncbi:TPA: hypothetical protein DHU97_01790 [Candidatus Saccharibacteria bacterium]|nr:hypothetical protein [Candidatus Saccharibacteria bacterium]